MDKTDYIYKLIFEIREMKIVFFLLLFMNVLLLIMMQFNSDQPSNEQVPTLLKTEKIKLLPSHVPCLEWGDFFGEDLKRVNERMHELNLNKRLSMHLVGEINAHWVYIPPINNARLAKKEVRRLKQKGISSFRVQEEGLWNNAISIALLRDENTAKQLLVNLKNKGIRSVKIGTRQLQQTKFVIREPEFSVYEKIQLMAAQFSESTLITTVCKRL